MEFMNSLHFRKNGRFKFKVRNRKNNVNINLCYKYAAAISASITVSGYGMIISWTSPSLPHLTSPESKFPVTEMQGAWIASLLSCGIIAGYLVNPFLIDTIGSKKTLLSLAVPQILYCILIYFGQNWILLCFARIIGGIGYGGGLCSSAVYVSQIGDENSRGIFLSFVKMFFNIGVFVTMVFGAFLSYDTMNLAILGIPIAFVVSFFFMPDTSQFCETGEYVQEKLTTNNVDGSEKPSDVFRESGGDVEINGFMGGANVFRGSSSDGNLRTIVRNSDPVVQNSKDMVENSRGVVEKSKDVVKNPTGILDNSNGTIGNSRGIVDNLRHIGENSGRLKEDTNGFREYDNDTDGLKEYKGGLKDYMDSLTIFTYDPKDEAKSFEDGTNGFQNNAIHLKENTNPPNKQSASGPESTNNLKDYTNSLNYSTYGPKDNVKGFKDDTEGLKKNTIGVKKDTNGLNKNRNGPNEENFRRSNWWKLFFLKNNRKALLIILCASFTEILSGHMAIVSFAQQIFEYTSASLKAEYAALILAALKIGASFFSTLVVEKFGRRHIFLTTGILASLSQGMVGLFFFLKLYLKIDVSAVSWLPLLGVSVYEVVGSIGMSSLYYVYQGELFSDDVKGQGVTCTNIIYEIVTFLVKLNFQMVIDAIGIYSVFWGFSVCCAIGSILTFWIAPETKGKSKKEIQTLLGDTRINEIPKI